MAAQDLANTAQQKQAQVEEELQNADRAFCKENENRACDMAVAQQTIVAL